jgi:hypothetical protein
MGICKTIAVVQRTSLGEGFLPIPSMLADCGKESYQLHTLVFKAVV